MPVVGAAIAAYDGASPPAEGVPMKKILVLLVLVAIGVVVAKKVREA
ncbi:MAG: hypothetical protein ABW033_03515 [Acidimicrobiia bacterium]